MTRDRQAACDEYADTATPILSAMTRPQPDAGLPRGGLTARRNAASTTTRGGEGSEQMHTGNISRELMPCVLATWTTPQVAVPPWPLRLLLFATLVSGGIIQRESRGGSGSLRKLAALV